MEKSQNFQLFSGQNLDLNNEQLDEIEQKLKLKQKTPREQEWRVKKFEK